MTSMRRHYVASTSVRRHVPAGICPPPPWPPQYSKPCPPNILNLPTPIYYYYYYYRQKREYEILKQNHENINKEHGIEKQRLDLEQQKIENERLKQAAAATKQQQEHEKYLAELEIKVRIWIINVPYRNNSL